MLKSSIYAVTFTSLYFGGPAGCLTPEGADPESTEIARDADQDLDLASVSQSSTRPCGGPGYTLGDFNGDGKTDMIVATSEGASWYFSNGDGTWTIRYNRSDLADAMFTPGDFNGDGKTDVIITTTSASYWYFSDGAGGWTVPYIRPDLALQTDWFGPYRVVMFTPGDFNGDGKTDVIISTANGSSWNFSNGDGTWTVPYVRPELYYRDPWLNGHNVEFTPGDFNGDGKTDLVITTSSGSFWYSSNGNGTWTYPYTRTDLPLGSAHYDAGDLNGDGKTDLLIEVLDDQVAYWYLSNGSGGWTSPLSMTATIASDPDYDVWMLGDFNGDGKQDVIREESTGSSWYFSHVSNGQYGVQLAYSRSDWGLQCVIK